MLDYFVSVPHWRVLPDPNGLVTELLLPWSLAFHSPLSRNWVLQEQRSWCFLLGDQLHHLLIENAASLSRHGFFHMMDANISSVALILVAPAITQDMEHGVCVCVCLIFHAGLSCCYWGFSFSHDPCCFTF